MRKDKATSLYFPEEERNVDALIACSSITNRTETDTLDVQLKLFMDKKKKSINNRIIADV